MVLNTWNNVKLPPAEYTAFEGFHDVTSQVDTVRFFIVCAHRFNGLNCPWEVNMMYFLNFAPYSSHCEVVLL